MITAIEAPPENNQQYARNRLQKYCNIQAISLELIRFNMQLMHNPEISGIQYQQGGPSGHEVREYLLENWNWTCVYCEKKDAPLRYVAAVNANRCALYDTLRKIGLPVEVGSGGLTKLNKNKRGFSKTHWLDGACVGENTPDQLFQVHNQVYMPWLWAMSAGKCADQISLFFLRTKSKPRDKKVRDFQTGDIIKATVTSGKKIGQYLGRAAVKATGRFNI